MGIQVLLTVMLASFSFALVAIVYDVTSDGISDRAAGVVTVLYLWPLAIVGAGTLAFTISLIWGLPTTIGNI